MEGLQLLLLLHCGQGTRFMIPVLALNRVAAEQIRVRVRIADSQGLSLRDQRRIVPVSPPRAPLLALASLLPRSHI